ncbi:hypothetical protein [Alteromonas flava]|uniref:hypothetical protein n=1 Tax=Alteromonas flava TaxID=2048003 RepID=UPI000C28B3CF|nr:hypothetical protein [Alteromonas flava]
MSTINMHSVDPRVGAIFSERSQAKSAARQVTNNTALDGEQVHVVAPNDQQFSRKVEGKSKPIGQNMLAQHLMWGSAGLLMGMLVALLLIAYGPAFTQQNPLFTFIALISPGLFIGLFVSALFSLRPNHDVMNEQLRAAASKKQWSVVVHLTDKVDRAHVVSVIKDSGPRSII